MRSSWWSRRASIPVVVVLAGVVLTVMAARVTRRAALARDELRFANAANTVVSQIEGRLDAYVAMLLGGAGLFAASDEVRLPEFRAYVERLQVQQHYPGIQGLGFSKVVRAAERDGLAKRLRGAGLPFRFWPDQPNADVHAIVFLEPQDARNRIALGYDMHADPVRREAMIRARDSGAPAASGRVSLVQELLDPKRKQAGFLIYVPVYDGGVIPETVEERRARLAGFVYSPFRTDDLLRAILPRRPAPEVVFDVYDGEPLEETLLHRSGSVVGETLALRRTIEIGGRHWTLVLRHGPGFRTSARSAALIVMIAGLLVTVLLFVVTQTQARAREAAERTAEGLRQSEEALRAANQAKDEFLAVISHELRTPLNAIMGWALMLRKGQVPPDKQAHAIDVIHRNAAAQAMLVEDVLDVSRAVAGRLRLEWSSVAVEAVLRAAIDSVRPGAEARRVALHESHEQADLGTIRADAARLQQIVANLLSNAIKFTPEGGQVTLSAARDARTLRIDVSDTGIGIEPEFLPFVFDRFRQADTSTTRAHTGVGLGLAIVRHLVELHGGRISVESEGIDRGSTFTVRLPTGSDDSTPSHGSVRGG